MIMKKFLETMYEVTNFKETEVGGVKKWIMSGKAALADKPNGNNRIYPKKVLDTAITALQSRIEKGAVKMSLDHPDWMGKNADCAAIMTKLTPVQDDGYSYYEAQIVDTTKGKDLKAILNGGGTVGVSTRGRGASACDQEWPGFPGKFEVISEGFKLDTVDFADNPSVGETEDDVHLENKKGDIMKTLEELRKEFPEAFKDVVIVSVVEHKTLTDSLASEKAAKITIDETLKKLIESMKAVVPTMFVTNTISETEVTKAKDSEILKITESLNTVTKQLTDSKAIIDTFESQKVKLARDNQIDKLKAENPDYFKMEPLVKKFESCITSDEVIAVFNANLEIVKAVKESSGAVQPPKTNNPKEPEAKKLNDSQMKEFNFLNGQRKSSGQCAMTTEQYLELKK